MGHHLKGTPGGNLIMHMIAYFFHVMARDSKSAGLRTCLFNTNCCVEKPKQLWSQQYQASESITLMLSSASSKGIYIPLMHR